MLPWTKFLWKINTIQSQGRESVNGWNRYQWMKRIRVSLCSFCCDELIKSEPMNRTTKFSSCMNLLKHVENLTFVAGWNNQCNADKTQIDDSINCTTTCAVLWCNVWRADKIRATLPHHGGLSPPHISKWHWLLLWPACLWYNTNIAPQNTCQSNISFSDLLGCVLNDITQQRTHVNKHTRHCFN